MNSIKEAIRQINGSLPAKKKGSKVIIFGTLSKTNSEQTVIANLALMYARAGEKVLILDTDFNSNVFNQAFKLKSSVGLSNYLSSDIVSDLEVAQQVVGENISVIPSGDVALEETEYLLGDPKLENLVSSIDGKYDRILINTQMFQGKLDSNSLFKYADGIVIVQDLAVVKKRRMLSILNLLDKMDIKILGYISAKK